MSNEFQRRNARDVIRRGITVLLSAVLCLSAVPTVSIAEPQGEKSLAVEESVNADNDGVSSAASASAPEGPKSVDTANGTNAGTATDPNVVSGDKASQEETLSDGVKTLAEKVRNASMDQDKGHLLRELYLQLALIEVVEPADGTADDLDTAARTALLGEPTTENGLTHLFAIVARELGVEAEEVPSVEDPGHTVVRVHIDDAWRLVDVSTAARERMSSPEGRISEAWLLFDDSSRQEKDVVDATGGEPTVDKDEQESASDDAPVGTPGENGVLQTQATAHTQAEAVNWVNSQMGKALDFDGSYGAQCVDLTCYYYQYLGQAIPWGNANQYVNGGAFLPAGWSYQSSPQPGDIAVWTTAPYGHVAIVTEIRGSQMVLMEQNYAGRMFCEPHLRAIDAQTYIRPDWPRPVTNREPVGMVASCERVGNHLLRVRGWAYDPDVPNDPIAFHVYVGGRAGGGGRCYMQDAVGNQLYANSQFRAQGMSEFDYTLNVDEVGLQTICIYAIDNAGGNNPMLNGSDARVSLYVLSDHPSTSVGSGPFVIRSAIGNLALDVACASEENAANVQVWERNDSAAQQFTVSGNCDGYTIRAGCSGHILDTWGGGVASLDELTIANVVQHVDLGGRNQRWVFEDAGDGYVFIRNQLGYYLDVNGAVNANGTNVQTYVFNGSDAQRWKLESPAKTFPDVSAGAWYAGVVERAANLGLISG